jgi:hypothetical protein
MHRVKPKAAGFASALGRPLPLPLFFSNHSFVSVNFATLWNKMRAFFIIIKALLQEKKTLLHNKGKKKLSM